jgi:cytochrome c oxidase cbb3-type subunit III
MSDFYSAFWSHYVAIITIASVLGCLVLLLVVALRKMPKRPDNTTGHVWDEDLKEMNNPMPMWWMVLFVITILFSLAYFFLYPGLGAYAGSIGWTSTQQHANEVEQHKKTTASLYASFSGVSVAQLSIDKQGMEIAQRLFLNNCAQCHGSDARGFKGYPNLTDDDWLHGGTPEAIEQTIRKGRNGQMPPVAASLGTVNDVLNVAHYVMSLSDDPQRAQAGKEKFAVCAACHGPLGKGNVAVGAPNLTDSIWLHGSDIASVMRIVNDGMINVMPPQESRLDDMQIRLLTAYVWGLANRRDASGTAPQPEVAHRH